MPDFNDLLISMKRTALEAVEASKPTSIVFGKVTSTSPLKINVDQKMTLGKAQLVLARNVTDHKVYISSEEFTGKRLFTIYNGLVVGDEVIMIQVQGGQKYIVVDRVI